MRELQPAFTVEIDLRGETLIYREANRRATVICTFGGDPCIVPRTLSGWWYLAERRDVPMTAEEGASVIARIADHCRSHFGMSNLQIEGE